MSGTVFGNATVADRLIEISSNSGADDVALRRFVEILRIRRDGAAPVVIQTPNGLVASNVSTTPTILDGNGSQNTATLDSMIGAYVAPRVINGNVGANTLIGGGGDDVIIGGGGRDLLSGAAGRDQLIGGSDNDTLYGGAGDDLLLGRGGLDVIEGDAGDDTMLGGDQGVIFNGGAGNDVAYGGTGADNLRAGEGADLVEAGAGDDVIETSDVGAPAFDGLSDTIFAGDGADIIVSVDGGNLMFGGAGADSLFTAGADTFYGDGDDDVVMLSLNDAADESADLASAPASIIGGAGADTFDASNFRSGALRFERTGDAGPVSVVDATSGRQLALLAEVEQVTIATSTGVSTVAISTIVTAPVSTSTITSTFSSTITGTEQGELVSIDDDDRSVDLRGGDDTLQLSRYSGGYEPPGRNDITLSGGLGQDVLDLSALKDPGLVGEIGPDGSFTGRLIASGGPSVDGGPDGISTADFRPGWNVDVSGFERVIVSDGAGGTREIDIAEFVSGASTPTSTAGLSIEVGGVGSIANGGAGADTITIFNAASPVGNAVNGASGDDSIVMSSQATVADAPTRPNTIQGGEGADILDISDIDGAFMDATFDGAGNVTELRVVRVSETQPGDNGEENYITVVVNDTLATVDGVETIRLRDETGAVVERSVS